MVGPSLADHTIRSVYPWGTRKHLNFKGIGVMAQSKIFPAPKMLLVNSESVSVPGSSLKNFLDYANRVVHIVNIC